MNKISLGWKEFPVRLDKINSHLKQNLSNNYDGLVCNSDYMIVIFKDEILTEDADIITEYWDNIVESDFNPTTQEIVLAKVMGAIKFGSDLIIEVATDNIMLGITQAGKTKAVSDYCLNLQNYLLAGSLYAAINEMNRMIAEPPPAELSPYVTPERIEYYKAKIEAYLA